MTNSIYEFKGELGAMYKMNYRCEKDKFGPGFSCGTDGHPTQDTTYESKTFKDGNKEYNIEMKATRNQNGNTIPVFEFKMTSPKSITANITADDIRKSQGKDVITFSKYSEVGKAFSGGKQDVSMVIKPEVVDFIKAEHDKKIKELTAKASAVKVTEWDLSDEGTFVASPNGVDKEFRPDLQQIANDIKKYNIKHAIESKATRFNDDRGYRWIRVKQEDILKAIDDAKALEASRIAKASTPEAIAKRQADQKRFSVVQQQWAEEEEMERSRE